MMGSGGVCVGKSLESGVRWSVLCQCVLQESDFSRREDVLHLLYLIKKYYKFCTFYVT